MVVNNVSRGGKNRGVSSNKHFNGECNYCGRFGHMKRDCFQLQRAYGNQQNGSSKGTQVQFNNA